MTVWELVALNIPTFVFSSTERHLETAMAMAERGYIRAYPKVGLPETDQQLYDFVDDPRFRPLKNVVDGLGVNRVIDLLVAHSAAK